MTRILFISIFTMLLLTPLVHAECSKKHEGKVCDKTAGKYENKRESQGGDIDYLLASPELKLTGDQRKKLEAIRDSFQAERNRVRSEVKEKREELEALLKTYNADHDKVVEKVKEMARLNEGLLLKATLLRLDARKLLTKEQFDEAKEIIDEIREKR